MGEDTSPSEEGTALHPPVCLSSVHLLSTYCIPNPVPGAGDSLGNKAECSLPRGAHSWGGGMEGDFKQMVTQTNRPS